MTNRARNDCTRASLLAQLLDGLRCNYCIAAVLFHSHAAAHRLHPWLELDTASVAGTASTCFFVLSGFLITWITPAVEVEATGTVRSRPGSIARGRCCLVRRAYLSTILFGASRARTCLKLPRGSQILPARGSLAAFSLPTRSISGWRRPRSGPGASVISAVAVRGGALLPVVVGGDEALGVAERFAHRVARDSGRSRRIKKWLVPMDEPRASQYRALARVASSGSTTRPIRASTRS